MSKYSQIISEMYGIDPEILSGLEEGDGSQQFKEIALGVFAAIDALVTENIIDPDKSFEIKYQLFDMMNWASKHLVDFNRA